MNENLSIESNPLPLINLDFHENENMLDNHSLEDNYENLNIKNFPNVEVYGKDSTMVKLHTFENQECNQHEKETCEQIFQPLGNQCGGNENSKDSLFDQVINDDNIVESTLDSAFLRDINPCQRNFWSDEGDLLFDFLRVESEYNFQSYEDHFISYFHFHNNENNDMLDEGLNIEFLLKS